MPHTGSSLPDARLSTEEGYDHPGVLGLSDLKGDGTVTGFDESLGDRKTRTGDLAR